MTITEATEKDISTIQHLARKSWESAYSEILSQKQIDYMLGTMYSDQELISHMKDPNYEYFLIKKGEALMGFIGYQFGYEEGTTKLHRIYLIPEGKGLGLGKSALDFLKRKVSERGDHRIILNVNKNNPSKKFYDSQGFTVYEEGVFDIGQGYVMDDYLMEFVL